MKLVLWLLLVALMAIMGSAFAAIVDQKMGPYDVSFDLTNDSVFVNSSASQWYANDANGTGYLSSHGTIFLDLKKDPEACITRINIMLCYQGIDYVPGGELSYDEGWSKIEHYVRNIDGKDGYLTIGSLDTAPNGRLYLAAYKPNEYTLVQIDSRMPLSKGTGDLLNTLHVAQGAGL
jgi:hypothetical protein